MSDVTSIFDLAGIPVKAGPVRSILKEKGLNWTVKQYPVRTDIGQIPNYIANYRSDNNLFLGFVHGTKYKVIQNTEAFDFIDDLNDFTMEKVGAFNGGKKVFVIGKSNEQICIDGQSDPVSFYMTFLHGHDGKSGLRFILSPIRMACMNQMNMMLKTAKFKYNIMHTGDVSLKLKYIQKAINDSHNYIKGLAATIDEMIKQKPSITITDFVNKLIPDKDNEDTTLQLERKRKMRNKIITLYNNKDDLQNYKGTAFGYFSAVSDMISHKEPNRKSSNGLTYNNVLIKNLEGNDLLIRTQELLAA